MIDSKEEKIRQRAHEIWEREGRPDGSHDLHWHQAVEELEAESSAEQDYTQSDGDLTEGNSTPASFDQPAAEPSEPAYESEQTKAGKVRRSSNANARPK